MTSTKPESNETLRPPVSPGGPSGANYVTGIADGNLAQGVGLRDFLFGVGVVFRLDKRRKAARDAAKEKKRRFAVNLPIRQIAKVAAPLVIAVAGYTAYQQLAGEPLPSSVVGTWSTSDGRYAGRSFWLNPTAVAFQNGTSTNDFSVHPIKKVTTKLAADTLKLTIDYEIEGKASTLNLAYRAAGREMRMVNQPRILWRRTGDAPSISQ